MPATHYALADGEKTTIRLDCVSCDRMVTLTVPTNNYRAWVAGELIQNALAMLERAERETLISGTCAKCYLALSVKAFDARTASVYKQLPAREQSYTGPFPRRRHSHRCKACVARGSNAVACYKSGCTLPQLLESCSWCRRG